MPAMHLISVDLPAPLSPTSAITSPERTSKSTSWSACTDPNAFETPRTSSVGASAMSCVPTTVVDGRRGAAKTPRLPSPVLLAVLRVLPDADLAALHEALLEEELVVALRDPDRRQQDRRRSADLAVRLDRRALDDGDRRLRGRVRLEPHRLVDGAGLPAGEDVLHALRRRVLAADRDRLEAVVLQRGDHRVAELVVRCVDGVDLVGRLREHLLEDRQRLLVVPLRDPLIRPLLEGAVLVQRAEHRVVALLEQLRVVVRGSAVQLRDDGMLPVHAVRPQAGDDALALELSDADVVERDVVGGLAADDEAVVVDDLDALRDGGVRDRRA